MMKSIKGFVILLMLLAGFGFWCFGLVDQLNGQQYVNQNVRLKHANDQAKAHLVTSQADRQPLVTKTTAALQTFFMTDWTFSNQQEFDNKRQLLKRSVSDEVYKNAPDLQPDTNNMVKQTGIVANFSTMTFLPVAADADAVTGTAIVTIEASNQGQPTSQTRYVYQVAYDPTSKLLTKLDRTGEFNVTADSDKQ